MPGHQGTTSERYMRAFAASLAACSAQAHAYGKCIATRLPEVERNCCQTEFESLKRCFYKEFRARRKA